MIKTRLFSNIIIDETVSQHSSSFSGRAIQKGRRGELGNILELRIGYSCNNNCQYCPVAQKRHLRDRTTEECKKILKENRQERNLLIISGGEPTIRKDIFELIAYARDLDYQWIQLKTNGRMFSRRDFTQNLVEVINQHPVSNRQREINDPLGYNFEGLDVFELYISLSASNPKLHDLTTGAPGSFEETTQGLKNLLSLNQIVTVNVVITKLNYQYLPEIAKYLDDLGVRYIEFSFVEPEGRALANFEGLAPKITDVQPYLFQTFGLKELKLVKSLPWCCVQGQENHLSERLYQYDRHAMYKFIDLDEVTNYYEKQIKNTVKKDDCKYCIYDPICYGLNKVYAQKMGFDELTPILGNKVGDLVEREKVEEFRDLKRIELSDLQFEFDNPELKVDFKDTKADVVAMLSGGVDSSLAAAIYAEENKDKEIVLITFSECYSPGAEGARISAEYLMKKYKNIVRHFIVPVPYILSKKFVFEDLEEEYQKLNYYPTCIKCKYLRLSYCIYLLRKYFGGNILISGLLKGEAPTKKKREERFLSKYSVKMLYPLSELEKDETIKRARMIGLPCQLSPGRHSMCLLGSLKSRLKKIEFNVDLFYENEENKFRELLRYNGISETGLDNFY